MKVVLKVPHIVEKGYSETKEFIKNNMKEICERKHTSVEEVIYFIIFVVPDVCLSLKF